MGISIGTYNLMKPNLTTINDYKPWNHRKEDIVKNIAEAKTDILCIQELSLNDEAWMKTNAEKLGYHFFYSSCKKSSGVGVLFKNNTFKLIDQKKGIFSGKDEQGKTRTRAFIQLDLEDKQTKKVSRIASMHLYGGTNRGNPLGRQQIENFRKQIEEKDENISQIILAGDFNSDTKDEIEHHLDGPCTYLLNPNSNSDYSYNTVPAIGKNSLIRTTSYNNRHLDWIFVGIKSTINPKTFPVLEIIPRSNQILNASDHLLHTIRVLNATDYTPL